MALLAVLLSFGLQFFLLQNVSATCYWPDGSATSTDYAPCNYGTTSMCCDTANNDICTPEGLCLYHKTSYTRDACTDSTWASPNCVSVCMSTDNASGTLTQCPNGTWCCTSNTQNCCDDNQNIKLSPTSSASSSSSSSSSPSSSSNPTSSAKPSSSTTSAFVFTNVPSSASTATGTTITAGVGGATTGTAIGTSTSSTGTSSSQPTSAGSSSNIGVGIGIGLGVGLPLVAGIIAATWYFRSRKSQGRSGMVELEENSWKVNMANKPQNAQTYMAPPTQLYAYHQKDHSEVVRTAELE